MLSRVDETIPRTQALCVCPTRELVVQNLEVTRKMGKHTRVRATSTANELDIPRYVDLPVSAYKPQLTLQDTKQHNGICDVHQHQQKVH